MSQKFILAASLAAAIAGPNLAFAAGPTPNVPVPAPTAFKTEKCYGLARAGQNDCASTGNHSCAGTSKIDADPNSWVFVQVGYCDRIVGGKLKAAM